ncbi:hypothetical protein D187_009253 [Cystobacter fuscus DSM 2262]|uniref:Uncharacterized protein n=1 Tax=Cystobacter fuscus (strain ATCC 25194 / DSM 2262 / NBRC 100088 / M29) TaxID=1242864 RepID=S9P076_CYSF2|nr:hypothetical protein D187_009253 [Cystobacter fuscus DSM 2262]
MGSHGHEGQCCEADQQFLGAHVGAGEKRGGAKQSLTEASRSTGRGLLGA